MFNKIKYLFIFILISCCFVNIAFAETKTCGSGGPCNLKDAFQKDSDSTGWLLPKAADKAGYAPSVNQEIEPIIGTVIRSVLSLLGVIFIILMIYGGFMWMTAKGNEQQVEKAKEIVMAAAIGLAIVVAAYAVTYFVLSKFTGDGTEILINP
jgi:hypothetical protein